MGDSSSENTAQPKEESAADLRIALNKERAARHAAEAASDSWQKRCERLQSRVVRNSERQSGAEGAFQRLIECLPVGVLVEDAVGRVVWSSQRYCDLFQLSIDPVKLRGTDLRAVETNASGCFIDPKGYVDRLNEVRSHSMAARGDILELSSGGIWSRDCLPIVLDGGSKGWVHILRDITEEQARRAALQKAETEAREAERKAVKFLAAVSHEMKNPLSAILGLLELLFEGEGTYTETTIVPRIQLNLDLLRQLVEDLVTFSQLDEGQLRLSEGPISLATLLQNVAEQMGQLAMDKGLELEVLIDEHLSEMVLGDESRVRQLLVSLVGNAIKFTSSGTVRVRVFRRREAKPDEVTYEVEDTGCGISEKDREHVFDRYFRGRATAPGSGLGLSICQDLVHKMGGKIGLESEEGRGTCVFFTLTQPPLSEGAPSDLDKHVPRSRLSRRPGPDTRVHVLVVEDDPANRRMLTRVLETGCYAVQAVSSAAEALPILQQSVVDVLLTDISMPGMDGIELVERLREWERANNRPPTPAMVVTAFALKEYQERCREAGVDVFLTKPINGTTLRRALAKLTPDPAKVLLVDDSWDARILLEVCLNQFSSPLEIHAANSGTTAIAACQEHEFALIFVDAVMPEMSGVETLQRIRALKNCSRIPAIAVTGLSEAEELAFLRESGFDGVLTKPIDRHSVHRVVHESLRASVVVSRSASDKAAIESAPTLIQLEALSAIEAR